MACVNMVADGRILYPRVEGHTGKSDGGLTGPVGMMAFPSSSRAMGPWLGRPRPRPRPAI
eukprot:9287995-Pyramimonas_sp.AAC.1